MYIYTKIEIQTNTLGSWTWAPAGIFPGGGKPLGGPQKICEGGPPYFF